MPDIFTTANQLVVLDAGREITWQVASAGSAPSVAGDGIDLQNSPTAYVRADGAATLHLYAYYDDTVGGAPAWYQITYAGELTFAASGVERINVAGASRLAVHDTSGGGASIELGRAVLE